MLIVSLLLGVIGLYIMATSIVKNYKGQVDFEDFITQLIIGYMIGNTGAYLLVI